MLAHQHLLGAVIFFQPTDLNGATGIVSGTFDYMTTSAGTTGQYWPYYNSSGVEWKDAYIEVGGKRY